MVGRKLEGTDAVGNDDEDEQLRMAIQASLAEMEKVRPTAPGEVDEPEYKPLPTYDLSTREAETLLTFAQTIDHAVGFGDQDLRRFPHAHALHDQAQMLSGKLMRNIEEKGTKQQMLSEMHDRLMMTIKRYDALLTEQDAYARRQQEEERARREAAVQQYGYRPYLGDYATAPAMPPYSYGSSRGDPYSTQYSQQVPPSQYMPQQSAAPTHQYAAPPPQATPFQAHSPSRSSSMYPPLPAGQSTPYSPEAYAVGRQWSAPLPARQSSTAPTSSSSQQVPPRQSSVNYDNQVASPPPLPQESPYLESHVQPQTAAPGQVISPQSSRAQPYEHPQSQLPLQEDSTSPARASQEYAYPSYPTVPSQAPVPNGTYALPSFPAFPDAPTANPPEPQKPVEREQPKEALLIEL